jgi:hypothetical protein
VERGVGFGLEVAGGHGAPGVRIVPGRGRRRGGVVARRERGAVGRAEGVVDDAVEFALVVRRLAARAVLDGEQGAHGGPGDVAPLQDRARRKRVA